MLLVLMWLHKLYGQTEEVEGQHRVCQLIPARYSLLWFSTYVIAIGLDV